ncbi:MAG: prepilin peptidase [Fimbriimonas sp.]|nr:prepilin peptidase [Fimbriimonas sp.]
MNDMPPMIPSWSWIFGLAFGATIGSFLNVVIYRLPRGMSLANPKHSFCPTCKHQLGVADLFPLLSFLSSGGKCRHCGEKVSSRYFWVESLNGALWAWIWWQYICVSLDPLRAIFYAVTTAALVAVIFIDWELYIIPDQLNATLLLFGIGYHAFDKSLSVALTGGLLGWGLLWGIALLGRLLFGKDAMGHGDIKMMRGVGALLGPTLLGANMIIAVVTGLIVGIAGIVYTLIAAKRHPVSETAGDDGKAEEPYQPETIGSLFVHGAWYLFCLDIPAIWFPKMYSWIGETASEENIEEDDWKPSLTTIPFGPYLAIGAIVCMLFGSPIEKGISTYLQNLAHPNSSAIESGVRFAVTGSKRIKWCVATPPGRREVGAGNCLVQSVDLHGEGRIGT